MLHGWTWLTDIPYPFPLLLDQKCREYAVETGLAVLLSGIAMYYLKRFGQFKDSISPKPVGKATILVYDDSKGVLDDVKMVRPEELGKMRVVG